MKTRCLAALVAAGAELRGRGEMFTGINYLPGFNDGYYLSRIRLNVAIEPEPWLRFFVQGQDAQAPGYSRKPVPSTVANTFDLRQGYLDLGRPEKVGGGNWGNAARSFDAARFIYQRPGVRVDAFSGAVVVPVNGRFDTPHFNNKFHGIYASFDKAAPKATLQPYFLIKTNTRVQDESGKRGDLDVYTMGARMIGKLPRRFDYGLETAVQTGHSGGDNIRAWAGHWQAGYTFAARELAPRIIGEYNHASGDRARGDGKRGTFDQLYPTNHFFYGAADQAGWRNLHDVMGGLEWRPSKKLRVRTDYHSFWLAALADSLYNDSGTATVRNPNATSRHVGQEFDTWAMWRYSDRLQLGAGLGHLFAGGFLRQSGKASGLSYPYVQWQYIL
jgi:hypothetical protein